MLTALLSAVLYFIGCKLIGERFPFSAFNLYSNTAHRDRSATPVFLADGVPAKVWRFDRFSGFENCEFLPDTVPTGLSWMAHEIGRWVQDHVGSGDPGPVQIAYGFRLYSVGENGHVSEEIEILHRGTAWRS